MADRWSILAEFPTPAALLEAARQLRPDYRIEAFTPFPVEGLDQAIGLRSRVVPAAFVIGGIVGGAIGFGMQVLVNLDFPLWIGGRPLIALPAFAMIAFELTILGAVLAGILTMLLANRLPKLHHPVFDAERFSLDSDDRFFLALHAAPDFDRAAAGKALAALDPVSITDLAVETGE